MRIVLNIPFTLSKIKAALGIEAERSDCETTVKAISTDSRLCECGDVFIAIIGAHQSGEDFIEDAKAKGAYTIGGKNSFADIKVSNTEDAILSIAKAYKSQFRLKETIAITGSVGKTTTKNITAALLSERFKVHATAGNFNNSIGVPYTIFSMSADTEILVVEAGMNHKGELKRLSDCIEPTIAVITNVGTAHIGNLGSREEIAKAKIEIIDSDPTVFTLIPENEPYLSEIINKATVSSSLSSANFFLKSEDCGSEALEFTYFSPSLTFKSDKIKSNGLYLKECLAFAIAVAITVGLGEIDLRKAISTYSAASGSNKECIGSITVIDDSYNASPESVRLALKSLSLGSNPCYSALLGDMLELGDYSEKYHYAIGRYAAGCGLKHLYLIGKYAKHIMLGAISCGMKEECIFYNPDEDRPDLCAKAIFTNSGGEAVLIKASRALRLERVKDILKDHFKKE